MTTNYDAALAWAGKGYNVVPRKSVDAKRPAVKWKELQNRRVTDAELDAWRPMFASGVGFITGAISGVVVIETDGPAGEAVIEQFGFRNGGLPSTLTIRSGSGRGRHLHFKHPGGKVKTAANEDIKVDVRGDGGFCVLPPSLHKSGGRYEIEHDAEPTDLPEGLLKFIEMKAAEANGQSTNGRVLNPKPPAGAEALGDNVSRRVPVNRRNVAITQSMLSALPDRYADDYDLWLRVGLALHSFDCGRVGLVLWRRFSARHALKAKKTDFEKVWATFDRPYDGAKITIGTLWAMARDYGWKLMAWDMRGS